MEHLYLAVEKISDDLRVAPEEVVQDQDENSSVALGQTNHV